MDGTITAVGGTHVACVELVLRQPSGGQVTAADDVGRVEQWSVGAVELRQPCVKLAYATRDVWAVWQVGKSDRWVGTIVVMGGLVWTRALGNGDSGFNIFDDRQYSTWTVG